MANLNFPNGISPLGICLSGDSPKLRHFAKPSSYATALFRHDAVFRAADGSIDVAGTPGTTPYLGVNLNYGAASTATEHEVMITPDALYEAQGDGSGSLDAADLGLNANLVLTAGNAATKVSKHQIAESTKATTNTLDVHLMELIAKANNDFGANARMVFVFNKHRLAPNVAGV